MRGILKLITVLCALSVFLLVATGTALALPAERHYEMVSPTYKGGFGVGPNISAVASGGNAVAFFSAGAFAGAPSGPSNVDYLARRSPSGWSTVPLMPPASLMADGFGLDLDPSLSQYFEEGKAGPNAQNQLPELRLVLHPTNTADDVKNWSVMGTLMPIAGSLNAVNYLDADPDFCHVILESSSAEPLVQEQGATHEIYQFDRGCEGKPQSIALVGLDNKDKLVNSTCGEAGLGKGAAYSAEGSGPNSFNAVSEDGSQVFFTVCLGTEQEPGPHHLFVRLAGTKTLEISRPLQAGQPAGGCTGEEAEKVAGEVPCKGAAMEPSANFAGASRDGFRVFFTTTAPLTGSDKDVGNDLYMATIGCPGAKLKCEVTEREVTSLSQVSQDAYTGQQAQVQGVVKLAPNGSRVYFVAHGDLLSPAQQAIRESAGQTVPPVGADNLYVYNTDSKSIGFIGGLCSGSEVSGQVADSRCPTTAQSDESLWKSTFEESHVQTAGTDGRFLVFTTYARMTSDDTDGVTDVYRYDAANERLVRVSTGENGYDTNGNRPAFGPNGEALGSSIAYGHYGGLLFEQYELGNRAVSEDGSRIVFSSAEPLSPHISNGLENVYEWHESGSKAGTVSLISSGSGVEPATGATISSDGSSVDFVTTDGLVREDSDGAPDIYDARLGEGFAQQPTERESCGDECQGQLTNPAPLLVPGSVPQAPEGNLSLSSKQISKKPVHGAKKPKKRFTRRKKKKARAKRRNLKNRVKSHAGRKTR